MSDREMLEFAAKAAGYANAKYQDLRGWGEVRYGLAEAIWTGEGYWNPLADDGDALRLAVRLNIPVFPYEDETSTGTIGVRAKNWGSKEANTRRAIVRAAAEIGRGVAQQTARADLPEDNYYKTMAEAEEAGHTAAEIGRQMP